jgi:hypothetical protein
MLEWTTSAQDAFQNAKRLLVAAVPLKHPAPNAELSLATDASDTHIGGVMQQNSGDNLTSFSPCLTGPVDYPLASYHKGPRFKSPAEYLCETGILLLALSCYKTIGGHLDSFPANSQTRNHVIQLLTVNY